MPTTASKADAHQRVLLVDDSRDLLEVFQALLEEEGYDVRIAGGGEEALEVARGWRPDLVVTDISMPGMNGFELITRIRSDFVAPVPTVVALSGFPDAEEEAMRRGALRFALKPVTLSGFVELVEDAIDGAGNGRPHRAAPHRAPHEEDGVGARRAAATAAAGAAVEVFFQTHRDALQMTDRLAKGMTRYFGHSSALVLLVRQGKLAIAGTSDAGRYPLGREPRDLLKLASDVIEGGAALIVPDTRAVNLSGRSWQTIRSVACVPFSVNNVVVGALALVDDAPRQLSTTDIGVLTYAAAHWFPVTSNTAPPSMMHSSGILTRVAFETFLGYTIAWAAQQGACFGITVVAPAARPADASWTDAVIEPRGSRMLAGFLDRHHVALFAATHGIGVLREHLKDGRAFLRRGVEIRASAELMFEAPVPPLSPSALIEWVNELLDRAVAEGNEACLSISAGAV